MAKTITIPLSEPIEGHGKLFHSIVLRAPTWGDVIGTGSPYTIHSDKEGKPFLVYDEAAIAHYASVLVVEPTPLLCEDACLADTLKVREAIVDFFLAARGGAASGSTTSPQTSSSSSTGSPTPSVG